MEKNMGRRTLPVLILPFLLLIAAGCVAKMETLHPDVARSRVQARVLPAEMIGIRWERDDHPVPPIPLPLTEADKAGPRTPATPGVGWLMLIEVNFSSSPVPREPAEREESAEVP